MKRVILPYFIFEIHTNTHQNKVDDDDDNNVWIDKKLANALWFYKYFISLQTIKKN